MPVSAKELVALARAAAVESADYQQRFAIYAAELSVPRSPIPPPP